MITDNIISYLLTLASSRLLVRVWGTTQGVNGPDGQGPTDMEWVVLGSSVRGGGGRNGSTFATPPKIFGSKMKNGKNWGNKEKL